MKIKYQVLADKHKNGKPYKKIHNFYNKKQALACLKELKKKGVVGAAIWDCYNNPLSRMF